MRSDQRVICVLFYLCLFPCALLEAHCFGWLCYAWQSLGFCK
ncbi:unnamed protein product [Staurois parvus]|uniref:Uncharacterized protein n=1 Tax=Staurois parvus TaxID=386267 RepID=A0ABN9BH85_9NEOB|nr:unnamed protein product [Staurois parvus]